MSKVSVITVTFETLGQVSEMLSNQFSVCRHHDEVVISNCSIGSRNVTGRPSRKDSEGSEFDDWSFFKRDRASKFQWGPTKGGDTLVAIKRMGLWTLTLHLAERPDAVALEEFGGAKSAYEAIFKVASGEIVIPETLSGFCFYFHKEMEAEKNSRAVEATKGKIMAAGIDNAVEALGYSVKYGPGFVNVVGPTAYVQFPSGMGASNIGCDLTEEQGVEIRKINKDVGNLFEGLTL